MIIQFPPGLGPILIERKAKITALPDEEIRVLFDNNEDEFFSQVLHNQFSAEIIAKTRLSSYDKYRNKNKLGVRDVSYRNPDGFVTLTYSPEILTDEQLVNFFAHIGVTIEII